MDRVIFSEFLIAATARSTRSAGDEPTMTPSDPGPRFDSLVGEDPQVLLVGPADPQADEMAGDDVSTPLMALGDVRGGLPFGSGAVWWTFGLDVAAMPGLSSDVVAATDVDMHSGAPGRAEIAASPLSTPTDLEDGQAQIGAKGDLGHQAALVEGAPRSSGTGSIPPAAARPDEGAISGVIVSDTKVAAPQPGSEWDSPAEGAVPGGDGARALRLSETGASWPRHAADPLGGAPHVPGGEPNMAPDKREPPQLADRSPRPASAPMHLASVDPALRKGADVDEKRPAAQTASTAPAEISATDTALRPSILVPHETKFAVVGGADVRAVRGPQTLVPELSLIAPGPVQKTVSPDSAGPPAVAARVREDVPFVQHAPPVISAAEAVPFGVSLRYLPAEYINARKAPDFAEGAQPVGATTQIRMTGAPAAPVSGAARPGGGPTMPDTDEASPAAPARQISEASGTPLLSGTLQPAAVPQNPAPQVQGDAGRATRLEQRDGALRDGTPEGALVAHRRPDVAVRQDVPDILFDPQERGTDIDATDDGVPGTRDAAVAVGSALPAMRGGAGPLGVSAHAITQQVAHAAAQSAGAPVELTLAPEELGRVRLTLHSTDAGITVSIHAERPETLDMMRRNIDLLARDFRDQGYQMIAFNFGTESQRQDNPPMAEPDTAPARSSDPVDVVPAAVERPISSLGPSLGGLDLRM